MSLIWLSPRLPADRSALAETLGPDVEIAVAPHPPAGTDLVVATVFERPLLERLAAVPGAGALLLLKPPGTATPGDLPVAGGPVTVTEAADVAGAAGAIRGVLAGAPAPWPASTDGVSGLAPSGWLLGSAAGVPAGVGATGSDPTGELPTAGAAVPGQRGRTSRRNWLASGGIIGAAALAAVVVLATQGGASGTSNTSFRGPNGTAGGYGFGNGPFGGGSFGGGGTIPGGAGEGSGSGSTGTAPGAGTAPQNGAQGSTTDRAAERQAFLACLTKNGVDTSALTQGQRPRLDPSDPTVSKALQACRSLMPDRGFRGGPGIRGDRDGDGFQGGQPPAGVPGMPGTPGGTTGSGTTGSDTTGSGTTSGTAGRTT